jgi:diguanylate cyclase (GGDEF)-like protein
MYEDLSKYSRFEGDLLINSQKGERWYYVIAVNTQRHSKEDKILLQQYDIHNRKIGELELSKEVISDPLTGLLNRKGFYSKLEKIEEQKESLVLFFIDLDGFKLVNDSFGHATGDQVLKSVANRLRAILPENIEAFISRFGGDEFIVGVVIADNGAINFFDEGLFADSMVSSLSDMYHENDSYPMSLSASIGLAHYPDDINVITEVVLFADAAMYQAKESGKRRWVRYQKGMERTVRRKSLIAQRLFYAEQNQELMLYYQPIWDFSEGKNCIVSFEALLRWHDDELGWVPAEDIVQVAEEIGIIDNIERWVAGKALSDLLILRDYINPHVTMAINISAVHLRVPKLPEFLLSIIEESQLTPSDLTVELTESALISDIEDQNHVVRKLADKGIKISIDDFGTGYSSLAYLHYIPATTVKIDRSFVERIEHDSKTIKHIQQLIEAHGMRALIEGVETQQQQDKLISFGVYLHQGYLKGKPKPLVFYCKR